MKKVIVIGAGPAGLTAAYELLSRSKDYEVVVFEESREFGGISKTVTYKGNRMDMGGHRFFSKNKDVMNWWNNMMPLQGHQSKDDLLLHLNDKKLNPNGPNPEVEDRVILLRHRVSRIFFS